MSIAYVLGACLIVGLMYGARSGLVDLRENTTRYVIATVLLLSIQYWVNFTSPGRAFYFRLRRPRLKEAVVYAMFLFSALYIFVDTFPRRVLFGILLLPLLPLLWKKLFSRFSAAPVLEKLALLFLGVTLLMGMLPGGYFPPFYNGIAGWGIHTSPNPKQVGVSGLQLVRDDGARQWFSHGVVSPINFHYRHLNGAFKQSGPQGRDTVMQFYWKVYCYQYPILATGIMPNQKYLGTFSYPGHTPYRNIPYAAYPPERIVRIEWASEVHDSTTKERLRRHIAFTWTIPEHLRTNQCHVE